MTISENNCVDLKIKLLKRKEKQITTLSPTKRDSSQVVNREVKQDENQISEFCDVTTTVPFREKKSGNNKGGSIREQKVTREIYGMGQCQLFQGPDNTAAIDFRSFPDILWHG